MGVCVCVCVFVSLCLCVCVFVFSLLREKLSAVRTLHAPAPNPRPPEAEAQRGLELAIMEEQTLPTSASDPMRVSDRPARPSAEERRLDLAAASLLVCLKCAMNNVLEFDTYGTCVDIQTGRCRDDEVVLISWSRH